MNFYLQEHHQLQAGATPQPCRAIRTCASGLQQSATQQRAAFSPFYPGPHHAPKPSPQPLNPAGRGLPAPRGGKDQVFASTAQAEVTKNKQLFSQSVRSSIRLWFCFVLLVSFWSKLGFPLPQVRDGGDSEGSHCSQARAGPSAPRGACCVGQRALWSRVCPLGFISNTFTTPL